MLPIGYYEYNRNSGSAPDRRITFYENEESIEAHVEAKSQGKWKEIAVLKDCDILVESETADEKLARFIASGKNGSLMQFGPEKKFSGLTLEEKKAFIYQLEPVGQYRLGIINGIGEDPRFEAVRRIDFFHPVQKVASVK